jgi:hypothetical protein
VDASRLVAAVLSKINDHTVITPYGHGQLVSLPLHYFDGDRVKLFVEPFQDGVRVTDRGVTLMRLNMADLTLTSPRVIDAWNRSVANLDLFDFGNDLGQISAWGSEEDIGDLIIKVAEASMRIDQLRWLTIDRRPTRFPERVISKLISSVGHPEEVLPQALLPQRSGRNRKVTAAVGLVADTRMYVQAVGGGANRDAQEKSVEHCFYLFQLAEQVPRDRRLAIAAGRREDWPSQVIDELNVVSDIAFFEETSELSSILRRRLAVT